MTQFEKTLPEHHMPSVKAINMKKARGRRESDYETWKGGGPKKTSMKPDSASFEGGLRSALFLEMLLEHFCVGKGKKRSRNAKGANHDGAGSRIWDACKTGGGKGGGELLAVFIITGGKNVAQMIVLGEILTKKVDWASSWEGLRR